MSNDDGCTTRPNREFFAGNAIVRRTCRDGDQHHRQHQRDGTYSSLGSRETINDLEVLPKRPYPRKANAVGSQAQRSDISEQFSQAKALLMRTYGT